MDGMRAIALIFFVPVAAGYNMMHAIDPMMVVCDPIAAPTTLPDGMTADQWPTEQEFDVFFEYKWDMDESKPHVITFVRASQNAVTIEYELEDATEDIVVPKRTVTLEAEANLITADSTCTCTGVNTGVDTTKFGADYGKSCSAWDQTNCVTWFPDVSPGDWCCKRWCYVSSTCNDAFVSEVVTNGYFSYDGACGGTSVTAATTCNFQPPDPCACIDVQSNPVWSSADTIKYGVGYGATCKTWDYGWCDVMYAASVVDAWCCQGWCWVGGDCPSKIPSVVWSGAGTSNAGIYYTLANCPDNATLVSSCPYRPLPDAPPPTPTPANAQPTPPPTQDPACNCLGVTPPELLSGRRRAGRAFPTTYGQTCQAYDKEHCSEYFPRISSAIWCCQSWCYVDENCASARASIILPGYFYSYEACPDDGPTLMNCRFGADCQGLSYHSSSVTTALAPYGANYGLGCAAWDSTNCSTWFGSQAFWDPTYATNGWCCDSWMYVQCSCPLSILGSISDSLCYSYALCSNPSTQYYNCSNQCQSTLGPACAVTPRRLDGTGQQESQDSMVVASGNDDPDGALSRRLSGRRRSGRSSGRSYSSPRRRAASSFSGSRRRAPPASRPAYSARRRAASYSRPRRRASPPTRRRAPPPPPVPLRRRTPPRRRTPATPRRRATPSNQAPTLPASSPRRRTGERRRAATGGPGINPSLRRRTTGVGGKAYSLDSNSPRRRAGGGGDRRRTTGYGYGSSGSLQQNYGGSMPAKTNYGYSGPGPKKNSKVPMMMAAAGGVAVGAVAGVGAYYMYQRYKENNWGSRNTRDQSWCSSPSGRMMRCSDCYQAFDTCTNDNQCFSGSCDYEMSKDTRQDDDMESGFIPMEFEAPLKLRITKISGTDFTKAKVCPVAQPEGSFNAAWQSASSFDVDLFVTLTQMENMDGADDGGSTTSGTLRCANAPSATMLFLIFGTLFLARLTRLSSSR